MRRECLLIGGNPDRTAMVGHEPKRPVAADREGVPVMDLVLVGTCVAFFLACMLYVHLGTKLEESPWKS